MVRGVGGQIVDGRSEPELAGLVGGAFGEHFGVAGLRPEQDRQRDGRGRLLRRRSGDASAGKKTGKEAVEISALFGCERRAFWNDRDGFAHVENSS